MAKIIEEELPYGKRLLRSLRKEKKLTSKQMAKELGMAVNHYSMTEVSDRTIGELMARRLADYFKVDYQLFMAK